VSYQQRSCSVTDCGRPHKGRGLCDMHLQRLRRTGTTASPVRSEDERFWDKVAVGGRDECWEWTGAISSTGYGVMRPAGKRTGPCLKAHRFSARLAGMDIDGLMVLHSCDNRRCVNPAHLRPGTAADNSRDMVQRGRQGRGTARLNPEQVAIIRALTDAGYGHALIAEHFGVSRTTVTFIHSRKTWKEVPPAARDLVGTVVEAITGEQVAA